MKRFIVAVDPGLNIGVALVDIDSDYFYFFSERDSPKSLIIDRITMLGRPVIVTTDRTSSQRSVKRIAHALNARAYFPKRNIRRIEKASVLRNLGARFKNQHEKDALATALITKRKFSKLMEKIENRLEQKGLGHMISDVKELVLRNEISVYNARNLVV